MADNLNRMDKNYAAPHLASWIPDPEQLIVLLKTILFRYFQPFGMKSLFILVP
jgi:hypothetical protein